MTTKSILIFLIMKMRIYILLTPFSRWLHNHFLRIRILFQRWLLGKPLPPHIVNVNCECPQKERVLLSLSCEENCCKWEGTAMKWGQPFIEWLLLTRSSKMLRWSLMDLSIGRMLKGIHDKKQICLKTYRTLWSGLASYAVGCRQSIIAQF